jgi:hypothetical protein
MSNVVVSVESARGCGYRKPGKSGVGIYLIAEGLSSPCGRLPLPLEICPCCSGGIKPTRGWTWITPRLLFGSPQAMDALAGTARRCELAGMRLVGGPKPGALSVIKSGDHPDECASCPVGGALPDGKHGLLWVGGAFYKTPADFTTEARRMGVSRKLSALPRGFKLGETWVYLAHREALGLPDSEQRIAGIFSAFKPTGVDLVIEIDPSAACNVPERAEKLAEEIGDGARIVKVVRDTDQQAGLFVGDDAGAPA